MHDYQWTFLFKSASCHKWFRGTKLDGTRGIACCDDSGETPDTADHKVLWLDKRNIVLIEGPENHDYDGDYESQRKSCFRYCYVVNLHGVDDDGEHVVIGGSSGNEVFDLVNKVGIKAAFVDWRERTTNIKPI